MHVAETVSLPGDGLCTCKNAYFCDFLAIFTRKGGRESAPLKWHGWKAHPVGSVRPARDFRIMANR